MESMAVEPGKKFVKELLKKGKLERSDNAVILNLEKYKLGVFILLKSDGTALYSTKDLGLFELKRKKIHLMSQFMLLRQNRTIISDSFSRQWKFLKFRNLKKISIYHTV